MRDKHHQIVISRNKGSQILACQNYARHQPCPEVLITRASFWGRVMSKPNRTLDATFSPALGRQFESSFLYLKKTKQKTVMCTANAKLCTSVH